MKRLWGLGAPAIVVLAVLTLVTACAPAAPQLADSDEPAATTGPAPEDSPEPEPVQGAFDISRVKLMDPADLPDGVPVPVPFGGTIDELHSFSEGQSLIVDYDPRFFATAAAFYQAWIEQEGHESSPLTSFGNDAAGWQIAIDGVPVEVQINITDDESTTKLIILWP